MKVVFSGASRADLQEIGDYIAADNPARAITFVDELIDAARRLGDQPRAFPQVHRYARYDLRRRLIGNYLIFYTVKDDQVVVVRILHGARDYERLLLPGS